MLITIEPVLSKMIVSSVTYIMMCLTKLVLIGLKNNSHIINQNSFSLNYLN